MKIGELAKATHTQVETIRYYEREGLLPQTVRTEGNYRVYGVEHLDRLSFIRNCRGLDMTPDEIRALLGYFFLAHSHRYCRCCSQVNKQAGGGRSSSNLVKCRNSINLFALFRP